MLKLIGLPGAAACLLALVVATGAAAENLVGIGRDDPRVAVDGHAPPWNVVVRLQIPGIDRCTAFVIAPRIAVTAAHCLWGARLNRFVPREAIHILAGYASGSYTMHTLVDGFSVAAGYDPQRPYATIGADVAVLTLTDAVAHAGPPVSLAADEVTATTPIALGGYSQDRAEIILADRDCHVTAAMRDDHGALLLRHSCTATHGTSGAPLLTAQAGGGWRIVGIQVAAVRSGSGGVAVPVATLRALLASLAQR